MEERTLKKRKYDDPKAATTEKESATTSSSGQDLNLLTKIRLLRENDLVMVRIMSFLPLRDRLILRGVDRWFWKDRSGIVATGNGVTAVYGRCNLSIEEAFQKVEEYCAWEGIPLSLTCVEPRFGGMWVERGFEGGITAPCWGNLIDVKNGGWVPDRHGSHRIRSTPVGHGLVRQSRCSGRGSELLEEEEEEEAQVETCLGPDDWRRIVNQVNRLYDPQRGLYNLGDESEEEDDDIMEDLFLGKQLAKVNLFRRETKTKLALIKRDIQEMTILDKAVPWELFEIMNDHDLSRRPFINARFPDHEALRWDGDPYFHVYPMIIHTTGRRRAEDDGQEEDVEVSRGYLEHLRPGLKISYRNMEGKTVVGILKRCETCKEWKDCKAEYCGAVGCIDWVNVCKKCSTQAVCTTCNTSRCTSLNCNSFVKCTVVGCNNIMCNPQRYSKDGNWEFERQEDWDGTSCAYTSPRLPGMDGSRYYVKLLALPFPPDDDGNGDSNNDDDDSDDDDVGRVDIFCQHHKPAGAVPLMPTPVVIEKMRLCSRGEEEGDGEEGEEGDEDDEEEGEEEDDEDDEEDDEEEDEEEDEEDDEEDNEEDDEEEGEEEDEEDDEEEDEEEDEADDEEEED